MWNITYAQISTKPICETDLPILHVHHNRHLSLICPRMIICNKYMFWSRNHSTCLSVCVVVSLLPILSLKALHLLWTTDVSEQIKAIWFWTFCWSNIAITIKVICNIAITIYYIKYKSVVTYDWMERSENRCNQNSIQLIEES